MYFWDGWRERTTHSRLMSLLPFALLSTRALWAMAVVLPFLGDTPSQNRETFSNMWATISHWLWPKFRDCLRLDFILVLKKVQVESAEVLWSAFSVHFPLETTIQAPEDPAWCRKEDLPSWVKFTFSFSWALSIPLGSRFWSSQHNLCTVVLQKQSVF